MRRFTLKGGRNRGLQTYRLKYDETLNNKPVMIEFRHSLLQTMKKFCLTKEEAKNEFLHKKLQAMKKFRQINKKRITKLLQY